MPDLIETRTPNGGWQFLEPKTNWKLDRKSQPSSISITLDQAAELLQKHRMNNPTLGFSTAFSDARNDIIEYNRARLGLPPPGVPKLLPHTVKGAAGAAVGHVSKTVAGIKLLKQWLGDGMNPVHRSLAENRAAVCSTCPQNQAGDFWQRMDALASHELRSLIASKKAMNLQTPYDEKLRTCQACDCWLPLKCWTPLKHIVKNTSAEVWNLLDEHCWIPQEHDAG